MRAVEATLAARLGVAPVEERVYVPEAGASVRVMRWGAGPDVLLAHGVTGTWSNFLTLLPELGGFRCHLLDLPGHGLSDGVDYRGRDVRAVLAGSVLAALDHVEAEAPAGLVGNSLGGLACLYAATAAPRRVGAVVLLGAPAVASSDARAIVPLNLVSWKGLGRAILAAPPPPLGLYRLTVRRGFGPNALRAMDPLVLDANRRAVAAGGQAASVASLLHEIVDWRGRPRSQWVLNHQDLASVTAPVLALWGADDPFQSVASARAMVGALPRGRLEVVQGRHAPWLEDVAARGRIINEFLAEHLGGNTAA